VHIWDLNAVLAAIADDRGAVALALVPHHVAAHDSVFFRALRDEILPIIHRPAIGELLR
jgi:hypothetical protein